MNRAGASSRRINVFVVLISFILLAGAPDHKLGTPEVNVIKGRVLAADGLPIRDATVALPAAGLADQKTQGRATTLADGSFALQVDAGFQYVLDVSALGFESGCIAGARPGHELQSLRLRRGAALSLTIEGEVASAAIQLIPADVDIPCNLRRERLLQRLARDIESTVRFEALSPGAYEVWILWRDGNVARLPMLLRTVTLAEGSVTALKTSIAPQPAPAPNESFDIRVAFRKDVDPRQLRISYTAVDGQVIGWPFKSVVAANSWNVRGPSCRGGMLLRVDGPGVVGSAEVSESQCRSGVDVVLLPAAEIRFGAEFPEGARPTAGSVSVVPCEKHDERTVLPYGIPRSSEVALQIPAGCMESSFTPRGLAAKTLGRYALKPEEIRNLGRIRFAAGSGLVVRVSNAATFEPLAGLSVSVIPEAERERRIDARIADLGALHRYASGRTNEDGWVVFRNVPAEHVRLLLEDANGYAEISETYRLDVGRESVIDDVRFGNAGVLEVEFETSAPEEMIRTVLLTPRAGNPWAVSLSPRIEVSGDRAKLENVQPGAWRATFYERVGATRPRKVFDTTVEIHRGASTIVKVPAIEEYTGRITVGGTGLAATLRLRPNIQDVPMEAESDDGGNFSVFLPSPGDYFVDVHASRRFYRLDGPVVFRRGEPVTIELPWGGIDGVVRDEAGTGVAQIDVRARKLESFHGTATVTTDSSGGFSIDGLDEGTWHVSVQHEKLGKGEETVTLGRDSRRSLVLNLERTRKVAGTVLYSNGVPLSGGQLHLLDESISLTSTRTPINARGEFSLDIPREAAGRAIPVVVVTPDGVVAPRRVTMAQPVTLTIPMGSGRLIVNRAADRGTADAALVRLISEEGVVFGPMLGGRRVEHADGRETLVIPLIPGRYRYVETNEASGRSALFRGSIPTQSVVSTQLIIQAGADTVIEIPAQP